jgi:nicotinamidase/pyrazinamidase
MSTSLTIDPQNDVLVVIDVQNDFCPGGALAVARGDEVVPIINRLSAQFGSAVLTQDWHPPGHRSFASSHPGQAAYATVEVDYGAQTLWPDHCVQGSGGADFHAGLDVACAQLVIRTGFRPSIDSYSAFFENDRKTPTGRAGYLRERGFRRVVLTGLATDYCVAYSAIDAAQLGFASVVMLEACRAIDLGGSLATAMDAMQKAGVMLVPA